MSYVPSIGEDFMVTWTSVRDRSYTDDIWRAISANDIAIVGRCVGPSPRKHVVVFRLDDVMFHAVPMDMSLSVEPTPDGI